MLSNSRCGILVVLLVSGCATRHREADQVLAHASATEFGDGEYACDETVAVAKRAGVDYKSVVTGCLRRHRRDLHELFWLSAHGGFDAASSEGHAAVVGHLLRYLGDGFFGPALAREDEDIRAAVLSDLRYDFGEDTSEHLLREMYPLTFGRAHDH